MKKLIEVVLSLGLSFMILISCIQERGDDSFVTDNTLFAVKQYELMHEEITKSDNIAIPRTLTPNGSLLFATLGWDWTIGFYPGSLWCLYDLTKDEKWRVEAEKYTEILSIMQYNTLHHDVGFIIGCSYLNGIRKGNKTNYESVIVQAAKSLSTRFQPAAGVLQSWSTKHGWQGERGWKCPVIIDNMMNLEILFEASLISGDSTYYNVAVSHANQTMKHHFREDGSCFHVVDYEPQLGHVRSYSTAQGYADDSVWARGQAWAIYGFTMCYRYTHNPEYLQLVRKICDFIFTHPNMPSDLVPYWDYDAVNIPNEPRDVSAASITASALYELCDVTHENQYKQMADKIMHSLASVAYRNLPGKNHNFLLLHSVGSVPHGNEIDVPLTYADYYFLEALLRKRALEMI